MAQPRTPVRSLSMAFGGGGIFGIAYALGVVDTLSRAGVAVANADMIGTSAGAWVAACLATGTPFAHLCELPEVKVPDTTPGLLQRLTSELFGDARSARVTTPAVQLSSGRRVFLSGADNRLSDIVAASSAVPALFRPVRIGGTSYIDGGVRSLVSADHAAPARHLLVVAPIAGPMFGPAGRAMELMLRREIRRWQRVHGGEAHLIRPDRAVASLARHPLQLFDKGRVIEAYSRATVQTQKLLGERTTLAGLVDLPEGNVA